MPRASRADRADEALAALMDDVRREAAEIFANPTEWMNSPNSNLGGETPQAMVEGDRAPAVLNLLRLIRHVGVS